MKKTAGARTDGLFRKIFSGKHLAFLSGFLIMLNFAVHADENIKIENEYLTVLIAPENSGKIISLTDKNNNETVYFKADDANTGTGKFRTLEDSSYFKDKYLTVSKEKNKAVVKGLHEGMEVSKTFTLENGRKYLKIETVFRDTMPVAGKSEISPWMHNAINISETPTDNYYFLPHEKGIRKDASGNGATAALISSNSNWMAYYNSGEKRGILLAADPAPKGIYYWCKPSQKFGTMELHYSSLKAVPDYKITVWVALLPAIDRGNAAALELPVKLIPEVPESMDFKPVFKDTVSLEAIHEKDSEKSVPLAVGFLQKTLVLSPDVDYPYAFGICGRTIGKDPRVIIDAPEEIELTQWCGKWWWEKEKLELLKKESVSRGGAKYQRYTFSVVPYYNKKWSHNYIRFFFRPVKNSASIPPVYYRSSQDGTLFEEKALPVEVIRIPASAVPKRFKTMMNCDYETLRVYPEWQKHFRHLGLNGIVLNYNVPQKGWVTEEQMKELVAGMKKDGFVTAVMGAGFFDPGLETNKDLNAVDINEQKCNNFDFSARGPFMDKAADRINKMAGELGVDIAISDYEAYFNGSNLSFTERTVSKFKQYFTESIKDLEYVDPKTVTLSKQKYPKHYKIWVDWKSTQFHEYLNEIAAKVKVKYPKMKIGFCTVIGVNEQQCKEMYLEDNKLWNNTFLDYNMCMLYNNDYHSMQNAHADMDTMAGMEKNTKAEFFPTLSLGWEELEFRSPPEDSKYIIYEAVTSGAKGYWIWPGFTGSNGQHYYYLAQANKVIAENEDVLMDGVRMDQIVRKIKAVKAGGATVDVKPKVIVYKNKILVYLAEYSGSDISIEASLQLPFEYAVKDVETGDKKGNIADGGVLKCTIGGKEKGRMFLLESISGKEIPADFKPVENNGENADIAEGVNPVFYDSFDTEPLKGVSSEAYPMYSMAGGIKNNCLKITDYRGACIYDEEIKITSGNVTVDFWYNPGREFNAGIKAGFTIFSISINDNYNVALEEVPEGKIKLVPKYNNNYLWKASVTSEQDSWLVKWYRIKVSFGKDGAALWIDNALQAENKTMMPAIDKISKIQLGRKWRTFGLFDEFKIYDGRF